MRRWVVHERFYERLFSCAVYAIGHFVYNGYYEGISMVQLAAKDAKNHFGELIDTAQHEPVTISKKGREVAVVISCREYDRLTALESDILSLQADLAFQRVSWLGVEASQTLVKELLEDAQA